MLLKRSLRAAEKTDWYPFTSNKPAEKATDLPAVNRRTLNASWIINEEELGRHMEHAVPQLEAEDVINLI
jgi:hypothetical protein